ncbi:hypothetical protein LINPERPRIM_LOCUS22200 [Linum perenne]
MVLNLVERKELSHSFTTWLNKLDSQVFMLLLPHSTSQLSSSSKLRHASK